MRIHAPGQACGSRNAGLASGCPTEPRLQAYDLLVVAGVLDGPGSEWLAGERGGRCEVRYLPPELFVSLTKTSAIFSAIP